MHGQQADTGTLSPGQQTNANTTAKSIQPLIMIALTSMKNFNEHRRACSGLNAVVVDELTLPVAGHVDTGVSSPGVQTSATGTFSPLLSVSIAAADGSVHSPLDAGSYASADAARVGGGLYKHLLQAACTLATDPAPKVARLGKAALRVADVELAPVSVTAGWCSVAHMHAVHLQNSICMFPASFKQTILSKSCRPSLSKAWNCKHALGCPNGCTGLVRA